MDLEYSEQQSMLAKTARDFLSEHCPSSLVREMEDDRLGYRTEIWRQVADLGWLGLIVPETYGGSGGTFLDLAVLLEETGFYLFPGPLLEVLTSEFFILASGSEEQKQALLPRIVAGTLIPVPAWSQAGSQYNIVPQLSGMARDGEYLLNGSNLFVPFATAADYLICLPSTAPRAHTALLVDRKSRGLKFEPMATVAKDKQFEVQFDNVAVPRDAVLGAEDSGRQYLDRVMPQALVSKSMEMLGGIRRIMEMTMSYAKQRVQFDRPIGSFQAVQHHCANMAIDYEASRYLAYKTAWLVSQGLPCHKEAYMSKAWLGDAYRRVAVLGKQIHGGYGVISEYDLQLYLRRQRRDEQYMADADFCREQVAQSIAPVKAG